MRRLRIAHVLLQCPLLTLPLLGGVKPAAEDLYLIQGCSVGDGPKTYAASLYEAEGDEIRLVRQLISEKDGTAAILAYPEERVVVFILGGFYGRKGGMPIPVLDMDRPDRLRTLGVQTEKDETVADFNLVLPASGKLKLLFRFNRGSKMAGYSAVELDSGKQVPATVADYADVLLCGAEGVGLYFDILRITFFDGHLLKGRTFLNLPKLTDEKWSGRIAVSLAFRNPQFTALVRERPVSELLTRESAEVWINVTGNDDWYRFELPGSVTAFRGFDEWIAGHVVNSRDSDEPPKPPDRVPPPTGRCNPAWLRLNLEDCTAPGVLYLLNTKTRDFITWRTGELDSEVLLVRGREVLYRAGSRLYRAQIQEKEISAPQPLFDSRELIDVHWVFYGPPVDGSCDTSE